MNAQQKRVQYLASNTYLSLNELTEKTINVWITFHGIGYLSRYFIGHFKNLDPERNYILAPQAPSKYYLNDQYKHVGASWLTREDTATEIENVLHYVDAVFKAEAIPSRCKLFVFGFSQGVSVAARWVARRKINCHKLLLYAGGIPEELKPGDFDFLDQGCEVYQIVGEQDEFIDAARMLKEKEKARKLFGKRFQFQTFEGGHEIRDDILNTFCT